MTTIRPAAQLPTARWNPVLYWSATGLFCVLFVYSGIWSILDPDGTRAVMAALGFPTYFLYPQAVAKLVGVAVILSRRSRTLSQLAFAGFLYDVLLAAAAHLADSDPQFWLAAFGVVVWGAAFWADHRRFPAAPLRPSTAADHPTAGG